MKIQKNKLIRLAATGAAGLAMAQAVSAATTLTGDTLTGNNDPIPNSHGDNAPGTPNIDLTWSSSQAWQSYDNWDGRGEVYQMDEADPGETYTILFAPDAGFNAVVQSMDIDIWSGGGTYIIDWDISGSSSGSLGAAQVTFSATGLNALNFGDITGAGSETLTMTLTINAASTGSKSYLAMDNLTFDQVAVPEPSSSALVALGLGAMAMRRRRK